MVYEFARSCAFTRSHFDVRRDNERLWQCHEHLGATRVAQDNQNFHYEMSAVTNAGTVAKYADRFAEKVAVA